MEQYGVNMSGIFTTTQYTDDGHHTWKLLQQSQLCDDVTQYIKQLVLSSPAELGVDCLPSFFCLHRAHLQTV
ncbi:hypothetical protein J6590_075475 [Homalodisca vitripennis]|nr:hypothetical protein J6590_075475 [Homalodisca vitripennis]